MAGGGSASSPVEYVGFPVRRLTSGQDAPLMSRVLPDGSRGDDSARVSTLFRLQSYIMRNNHTISAGVTGENTIYAPAADSGNLTGHEAGNVESAKVVFTTKLVRDGSIRGFLIRDAESNADLLKIHFHGDTSNPFSRATKAFLRSPVIKWDVENYGLFSNLPSGKNLGMIRDVFGVRPQCSELTYFPCTESKTGKKFRPAH